MPRRQAKATHWPPSPRSPRESIVTQKSVESLWRSSFAGDSPNRIPFACTLSCLEDFRVWEIMPLSAKLRENVDEVHGRTSVAPLAGIAPKFETPTPLSGFLDQVCANAGTSRASRQWARPLRSQYRQSFPTRRTRRRQPPPRFHRSPPDTERQSRIRFRGQSLIQHRGQ